MAAGQPVVKLADKSMYPGDVLYCNGTDVDFSMENPTGYAELSADGKTLTLNNFDNNGFCGRNVVTFDESALIVNSPVTLNLQGQNKLSSASPTGEGISMHGDTTIQGTGSLEINASFGIFNWGAGSNLAITSGDLTIKGYYANIIANNFTITGGKLDLTSESNSGIVSNYDLTISGGEVNIDAHDAIYSYEDIIISGGEVNLKGQNYTMGAQGEIQLTGGKMTLTYKEFALSAHKIICTLPIPEGVEIRSMNQYLERMDYTEALDQFDSNHWNPQWRTFQLPAQTTDPVDPAVPAAPAAPAAPAVPTTGDNANIALWAALAVMSAAGMLVIRRRRSV